MLKALLIAVIVLASIGLGNSVTSTVSGRMRQINLLLGCVKAMKNGMVYQGMTFYEALRHASGVGMEGFFSFCAEQIKSAPTCTGAELCKTAMAERPEEMQYLKEREKAAFVVLMDMLSRAVLPGEVAEAAGQFGREMAELMRELSEGQYKKAKAVKTVCVLSGLVLAIVVI